MYKKYKSIDGSSIYDMAVIRTSDGATIPFDLANTDYQAFLKYQAEGGVVLPADNNEQTA